METRRFSPQDRAIADAVVASRSGSLSSVSLVSPEGWERRASGVTAHFSTSTIATLNSVFVADDSIADPADVDAMLTELAGTGRAFSLQLRGPITAQLRAVAVRHGLAPQVVLPVMVVDPDDLRPVSMPAGAEVRTLAPNEVEPHARLASLGLEVPLEDLWTFLTPTALASERWTTYLATVDGAAAATAAALVSGDHVGLMSIVTDPAFRGRGIAAGLTSEAVCRAFDSGIVRAFLQSSPSGYSLYERLGFREIEQWHIWA